MNFLVLGDFIIKKTLNYLNIFLLPYLMKKTGESKDILGIFLRYLILVLVAFQSLWIFYFVFTPLTVYPVSFLLNIFFDASLLTNTIILINQTLPIEIIEAWVAG